MLLPRLSLAFYSLSFIHVNGSFDIVIEQELPVFLFAFFPPCPSQFHCLFAIEIIFGNKPVFHLL